MKTNVFIIAALSGFVASAANAQTTPVFAENSASAVAAEAIEDQITDAAERPVFANDGRAAGSYGSMSLRGTAATNDGEEDTDLGVGLRYGTFDGVNSIDVTAAFNYSDGKNADGTDKDQENTLLLGADYRRSLTDAFFAYGSVNANFNKFATGDSATQTVLVSAGIGYRIFNSADTQWSVQAGPGYTWSQFGSADADTPVALADSEEATGVVSSSFFKSLTDTTFITNDTDIAITDVNTTVTNELALNVSLTDTLALRTSYATFYDDASDDTFSDGSNTLGVSVVYNFN